jgi:thiamine biosynthesis protein ThiS
MQVEINGKRREVRERSTLKELVEELSLAPERLAIELNQRVVRRAEWSHTTLQEGDHVEIVHFVGGGKARQKDR